ncbi:hypothetical protein I4U23_020197 [Adineta vaga]|nr:hypothetical protein I4U23_020197 [Adineta vaga]
MAFSVKDRLTDIHDQIQANVLQVQVHHLECQRLTSRIDQLIDPLERLEHATSVFIREETRPLLENFLQCLDDCNNFIQKFTSSTQSREDVNDHQQFDEFNQRFSQFGQDLCLGLNIQEVFNRQQDSQNLSENMNQISQQISQQQQEQIICMKQILEQRFQSFRHHFEKEKLSNKQDSNLTSVHHQTENEFLHIPFKDLYLEDKPLGTGGFADVYKGIWLTHHDDVAIKVLHLNHFSDVQTDLYREMTTMSKIRYEHVVTFLGACIESNFYAIVIEYMPLGSLYDIIHKKNEQITLSWLDRYSLTWQMAKSINYLHNYIPCIIHRDIKSMNFLIKQSGSNQHRFLLKVCDFGLAEIRYESLSHSKSFEIVGSLAWKAPELFTSFENHTKQTDIYSLGITMWELVTEMKPWNECADETLIKILVLEGKRPLIPTEIPDDYRQAIENAWNQNPSKRPSCFNLMEQMRKQWILMHEREQLTTDLVNIHIQQTPELTSNLDSTKLSMTVAEENQSSDRISNIIIPDRTSIVDELEINTSPTLQNPSNNYHFNRSLSKSNEDLSTNELLAGYSLRESWLSKSSTNPRRSIVGRSTTPSSNKDLQKIIQFNRRTSFIKQDADDILFDNKF